MHNDVQAATNGVLGNEDDSKIEGFGRSWDEVFAMVKRASSDNSKHLGMAANTASKDDEDDDMAAALAMSKAPDQPWQQEGGMRGFGTAASLAGSGMGLETVGDQTVPKPDASAVQQAQPSLTPRPPPQLVNLDGGGDRRWGGTELVSRISPGHL